MEESNIYLGDQFLRKDSKNIKETFTEMDGEQFYQIENYRSMDPFFMTLTSSSNHWMFISSTGGLTAGRVDSESSIFPYYTDDRITENSANTGPRTLVIIKKDNKNYLWKPFTEESSEIYDITSVLSKNIYGNIVKFQEINRTLGLSFSYYWMNSKKFGLVRKSLIENISNESISLNIVDGLQNILPAGVESQVQNEFSCLLNGYKRTELDPSGLGLFTLSAKLTDLAEPSESLKANTIWQSGLDVDNYLLGNKQIKAFCHGEDIITETDEKGDRGCYYIQSKFNLDSNSSKDWLIVADVEKDLTDVNELKAIIKDDKNIKDSVLTDVKNGTLELKNILNQNDGIQITNSLMNCVHHQENVLFNIMRGGYFYNSYLIGLKDFTDFVKSFNIEIYNRNIEGLNGLPQEIKYDDILNYIINKKDYGLERAWYEYLPLTFSRRHGDPSRPWNRFSIQTTQKDGSPKLDYQGNWRDIFQNWEALCFSYPDYIKHVIGKFLNASTKDGYNPYRVAKNGIDWECPEPGNPWANIGYWSDHQIIYLLKLLEMYKQHKPNNLKQELNDKKYTFANVPYQIKSYKDILADPYVTILFNDNKDKEVKDLAKKIGSEGKMLHSNGEIVLASLSEKLLIHLLTKLGNFIPEGGIWMNTQRPEWNDANNALVGKGISVVTMAYIRRYLSFLIDLFSESDFNNIVVGEDTKVWLLKLNEIFSSYSTTLESSLSNSKRFDIVKQLGEASDKYRSLYYNNDKIISTELSISSVLDFLKTAIVCIDDSLYKNRRDDNLYHSYNTLEIKGSEMIIHNLYEMLEGQVAILTSGLLTPEEANNTFSALKVSAMYRADQNSYMLYPNRELTHFVKKNIIPTDIVENNSVLSNLIKIGNKDLITKDINGEYHFNGSFHNSKQVTAALKKLNIVDDKKEIETIFENTFNHQSFTGRSGTFFAYEGLGSIYWHMVSKLLLAAQENIVWALNQNTSAEIVSSLTDHYKMIREGIGYKKSASVYGAFPFDPYSHTPIGKGAKQPGMTGQVKEEVITRLMEMGLTINNGEIHFNPLLVDSDELLTSTMNWQVLDSNNNILDLTLPKESMGGTHCQTPYIVKKSNKDQVNIYFTNGDTINLEGNILPEQYSSMIFKKNNLIKFIEFEYNK